MKTRTLAARLLAVLCLALLFSCARETDPIKLFERGDYTAAFEKFSEQHAAGDIIATNYLGMHYYMGVGVERDFKQALAHFEQAALAEHPGAQRNLGMMYLRGLGVEQDNREAYGWLYFAAKGGNVGAQDYLEQMIDNVTPNAAIVARKAISGKLDAARKRAVANAE